MKSFIIALCMLGLAWAQVPSASIIFTSVPKYGTWGEPLKGKVIDAAPEQHNVAVYILVGNGWWTKPAWDQPLTHIQANGTFQTEITTGGNDHLAVKIAAFLVRSEYQPPLMSGGPELPQALYQNAVAHVVVVRNPDVPARIIHFAAYDWTVKSSLIPVGPGPNLFSDSLQNVWVDGQGYLHLKITKQSDGKWYCAEIVGTQSLGYGTYSFDLLDTKQLSDPNVVLGLFTWSDDPGPQQNHREIDVEVSQWAIPGNPNTQFVVQPWQVPANMMRFDIHLDRPSLHTFHWRNDSISFMTKQNESVVKFWRYTGTSIPTPGIENPRLNLWIFQNTPSQEIEVVIRNFTFTPPKNR